MPDISGPLLNTTLNGTPLLSNAYFTTSAARLASGQKRHESWPYYQEGIGPFQLLPLAQCFLADGTTPATNRGTWGTLDAHWLFAGVRGAVPVEVRNFVIPADFDDKLVMTQDLPANLLKLCQKGDFFSSGDYWYIFEFSDYAPGLRWQRNFIGNAVGAQPVDLEPYALLDSPEFVGSPTVPTVTKPDVYPKQIVNVEYLRIVLGSAYSKSRTLYVNNVTGSTLPPQRGNTNRPYSTLQAAHDAGVEGDFIEVVDGNYPEDFIWSTNLTIIMRQNVRYDGLFQCSKFIGTQKFKNRQLFGGEFTNRVLMWRQLNDDVLFTATGCRFTGAGNFELNGGGSNNDGVVAKAILRDCTFISTVTPSPAAPIVGPIRVFTREDMGPVVVVLDNTTVRAPNCPAIEFKGNLKSYIELAGATDIQATMLVNNLPMSPSNTMADYHPYFSDNRFTAFPLPGKAVVFSGDNGKRYSLSVTDNGTKINITEVV